MFEVWTTELAKMDEPKRMLLLSQAEDVKKNYQQLLLEDSSFQNSFTRRTSNKQAVETRFITIRTLIQKFTHD